MVVFLVGFILSQPLQSENEIQTYLERSVPFVGTEIPRMDGIDGTGIKIAIIDTGVDFNHPDLFGWGSDGKVIGGYNFIQEDQPPMDTNGHGTQVAGVIAADGQAVGIAPKAKILAYKVSEDGEGVSSELIIRAIEKAIVLNSGPSFPAAVTTKISFSNAAFTARSIFEFVLFTPKLILIISAPASIAFSMALVINSADTPSPSSETL